MSDSEVFCDHLIDEKYDAHDNNAGNIHMHTHAQNYISLCCTHAIINRTK